MPKNWKYLRVASGIFLLILGGLGLGALLSRGISFNLTDIVLSVIAVGMLSFGFALFLLEKW